MERLDNQRGRPWSSLFSNPNRGGERLIFQPSHQLRGGFQKDDKGKVNIMPGLSEVEPDWRREHPEPCERHNG